jgi:hypothetical protein
MQKVGLALQLSSGGKESESAHAGEAVPGYSLRSLTLTPAVLSLAAPRDHPRARAPRPGSCRFRMSSKQPVDRFPNNEIETIQNQEARNLRRFDVDFDLPDHLTPEFPPPIFLTTHPELGDVSQGQLLTIKNYYALTVGILTRSRLKGCGSCSRHSRRRSSTKPTIARASTKASA